jgi:hypothetical protein
MQGTMKDYSGAKHSNANVTPDCESVNPLLSTNVLNHLPQNISNGASENTESSIRQGNNNTSVAGNDNLLNPQYNTVENNTGITGITGTGHTIYNYACPPEIIELIKKLTSKIS